MTIVGASLQVVLAAMFVAAAAAKTFDRERFLGTLRLSGVPPEVARRIGAATPIVELAVAAGLVFAPQRLLGGVFAFAAILLVVFTAWVVGMLKRDLHVPCGCFGRTNRPMGWWTIIRNVGLICLAVVGTAFATVYGNGLPGTSIELVMIVVSFALSLMLLAYMREAAPFLVITKTDAE